MGSTSVSHRDHIVPPASAYDAISTFLLETASYHGSRVAVDVQQRGSGVGAPGRILQRGTRRSMRVRVRVRLRAARARACVRASVVRAGPREQARGAKPDADGFRWLAACCTVLQLVVLQRVRE